MLGHPTRTFLLALAAVCLSVAAVSAESSSNREGDAFLALLAYLEATPIDCPGDIAGGAGDSLCATVDLGTKATRKAVGRYLRSQSDPDGIEPLSRWKQLDGGVSRRFYAGGAIREMRIFDGGTLALLPSPPCSPLDRIDIPSRDPSEEIVAPRRIGPLRVEFPERARAERRGGLVVVQALVDRQGAVTQLCVASAEPEGYGFEQAALDAVRRTRYEPARSGGEPVEFLITTPVRWGFPSP